MNELAATKFPLRSANELQTDDCTTAKCITERIVRWCGSVIIQQQYIYCLLLIGTSRQISPSNIPWRPRVWVLLLLYSFCNLRPRSFGRSRPHPGRLPPGKRPVSHCTRGWFDPRVSVDDCWERLPYLVTIPGRTTPQTVTIPTELFWLRSPSPYCLLLYPCNGKNTVYVGFISASRDIQSWNYQTSLDISLSCMVSVYHNNFLDSPSFVEFFTLSYTDPSM